MLRDDVKEWGGGEKAEWAPWPPSHGGTDGKDSGGGGAGHHSHPRQLPDPDEVKLILRAV